MRILLTTVDIFHGIGGGQSFYKLLIKAYPKIEFSYFVDKEPENTTRLVNTKTIKLKHYFPTSKSHQSSICLLYTSPSPRD